MADARVAKAAKRDATSEFLMRNLFTPDDGQPSPGLPTCVQVARAGKTTRRVDKMDEHEVKCSHALNNVNIILMHGKAPD